MRAFRNAEVAQARPSLSSSWAESNLYGLWKILTYGSLEERVRVVTYLFQGRLRDDGNGLFDGRQNWKAGSSQK